MLAWTCSSWVWLIHMDTTRKIPKSRNVYVKFSGLKHGSISAETFPNMDPVQSLESPKKKGGRWMIQKNTGSCPFHANPLHLMGEIPCSLRTPRFGSHESKDWERLTFVISPGAGGPRIFQLVPGNVPLPTISWKKETQETNREYRPPKTRKWMVDNFPKFSSSQCRQFSKV